MEKAQVCHTPSRQRKKRRERKRDKERRLQKERVKENGGMENSWDDTRMIESAGTRVYRSTNWAASTVSALFKMQFASVAFARGNHKCALIRASFPAFVAGGQKSSWARKHRSRKREERKSERKRKRVLKPTRDTRGKRRGTVERKEKQQMKEKRKRRKIRLG